jgi:hypothetical protein
MRFEPELRHIGGGRHGGLLKRDNGKTGLQALFVPQAYCSHDKLGVTEVRLIKLLSDDGPVYVNPEHVVTVRKALKDTRVETVAGPFTCKEDPAVVVRLLGAEELAIDITPALADLSPR